MESTDSSKIRKQSERGVTLVMGASLNPSRYSNLAVRNLRDRGSEVIAFGRTSGMIDDVEIRTELSELPKIDTVLLYLNPSIQSEYHELIFRIRPRRVIFNPGTENPNIYSAYNERGIEINEACALVLLNTNQYWSNSVASSHKTTPQEL